MSDQVRNRNVLFSKLDRDEELNLDGTIGFPF